MKVIIVEDGMDVQKENVHERLYIENFEEKYEYYFSN